VSLYTLLARTMISKWNQRMWFVGAELVGHVLLIDGDRAHVAYVRNCWGEAFRQHVPNLEIRQRHAAGTAIQRAGQA
jgi:hypothetical protein